MYISTDHFWTRLCSFGVCFSFYFHYQNGDVMIFVIKLISLAMYPLGLSIMLLGFSLLFRIFKLKMLSLISVCLSAAILILCSSPLFARTLIRPLEKKYTQQYPQSGECSAIVVLGGGGVSLLAPRMFPEINEAGDRIIHGARLLKKGVAPIIIPTGQDPTRQLKTLPTEAKIYKLLFVEMGVDSSKIVMEEQARTTYEHARYVAQILDSLQLKRSIMLVTTASHMPRSVAVFKKYGGFTIFTGPTDYRVTEVCQYRYYDYLPSIGALEIATTAIHEYYGLLQYKISGWI
jgi:uncharacterized SAM-binding protein YcdF (DUF218 family)